MRKRRRRGVGSLRPHRKGEDVIELAFGRSLETRREREKNLCLDTVSCISFL